MVRPRLAPGDLDVALAGRLVRRPTLLHLHEQQPRASARVARNMAVLLADSTLAVSRAVADELAPRARRKATVVSNGVDTTFFVPGPPSDELRADRLRWRCDR